MDARARRAQLAQKIDHTNLKPDASLEDIKKLCEEAVQYQFRTVCIHPDVIRDAKNIFLQLTSSVPICAVIGFPFGKTTPEIKALEARFASGIDRASEVDMVINIGRLLDGDTQYVKNEIRKVREIIAPATLKVIIETGYLSDDEIKTAATLAAEAGAHFVKTSTGFGPRGASLHDIELIREAVGDRVKIKAAGGIKTYADAQSFIDAGADRLGTSNSVAIMKEFQRICGMP